MFYHHDLKGFDLPEGTVCLTYNDGPGPETADLAGYLADEGIRATFFVIGRLARQQIDVLDFLYEDGHVIANHTYSHPGLVDVVEQGEDAIAQLAATHEIISPYVGDGPVYFRAPYGQWRQVDPHMNRDLERSIVAAELARWELAARYVGPVHWDISAEDCGFWKDGRTPEECADAYVREIRQAGRGIVLLHDGSEDPLVWQRNHSFTATKLIVAALRAEGFKFCAIDEVPSIRAASLETMSA